MERIILIAMATLACGPAAFAQQLPIAPPTAEPARPGAWSPPPARENRVLLGQLAGGAAAVTLVGLVGLSSLHPDDDDAASVAARVTFVAAPLAAGVAVCAIGRFSAYESNCGFSGVGAYIGALVGGYAGYQLTPSSERGEPSGYVAIGAILGTTLGATTAWHLGKRPRAGATKAPPGPPQAVAEAWPELRRRPPAGASSAPGARRVMFPVLALSF